MSVISFSTDQNGNPVQILGFAASQLVTVGSTDPVLVTLNGVQYITLAAIGAAVNFQLGDEDVVADVDTSPVLLEGVYVDVRIKAGQTHISFLAPAGSAISVYVMDRD